MIFTITTCSWKSRCQKTLVRIAILTIFWSGGCSRTDRIVDAVKKSDYTKVKELLEKGYDPNTKDKKGNALLHWAVWEGSVDIVNLLILQGADCNVRDPVGRTPLRCAIGSDKATLELVSLLLRIGCDANLGDIRGRTPLHEACISGKTAIVEILLSNKANPNCQDKMGETPLHYAAWKGYSEIARLLLKYGARQDVVAVDGKTPAMLAQNNGHGEIVLLMTAQKVPHVETVKAGTSQVEEKQQEPKSEQKDGE